jgi:SnoaL-like domain
VVIDPERFAHEWLAAWNAHELEGVLRHFSDHATFCSPFAATLLPETGGRLAGKGAIRNYWRLGLSRTPDLHFTLEQVFAGVETLAILYRNQRQVRVVEILRFEAGLVVDAFATYAHGQPS